MRRRVILLIITVVAIVGDVPRRRSLSSSRPVLGLDLQGGISIVLFPVKGADLSALNTAVDVIRNRVDGLGIAEPDVQRQGNTIVVNLPGVKDRAKAESLVGQTAELRFREVTAQYPWAARPGDEHDREGRHHHHGQGRDHDGRHGRRPRRTGAGDQPGTTFRSPAPRGKALGRTIDTAPIAKRYRAATPSSTAAGATATTAAAPATTAGASVRRRSAGLTRRRRSRRSDHHDARRRRSRAAPS